MLEQTSALLPTCCSLSFASIIFNMIIMISKIGMICTEIPNIKYWPRFNINPIIIATLKKANATHPHSWCHRTKQIVTLNKANFYTREAVIWDFLPWVLAISCSSGSNLTLNFSFLHQKNVTCQKYLSNICQITITQQNSHELASHCPLGLNFTEETALVCPLRVYFNL